MRGRCGGRRWAPGNDIGDTGAAAIAEALKINNAVSGIDLRGALRATRARAECCVARGGGTGAHARGGASGAPDNDIGDAGAAAIADALKMNKTVTTIDLSCALREARARGLLWRRWNSSCGGWGWTPGNHIGVAGAVFSSALLLNLSLRVVGGIPGLDAELANRYRIPYVRFLVRMRALCLSERGVGTDENGVCVWLANRAPLWVLVRVCGLIGAKCI